MRTPLTLPGHVEQYSSPVCRRAGWLRNLESPFPPFTTGVTAIQLSIGHISRQLQTMLALAQEVVVTPALTG